MPRKRRQLVLLSPGDGGAMKPLGKPREVRAALADFNTGPDGGPGKNMGTEMLYGPGMVVEIPATDGEVTQAIVNVSDEETAWPVLSRMCKSLGWKMMDVESGQTFG